MCLKFGQLAAQALGARFVHDHRLCADLCAEPLLHNQRSGDASKCIQLVCRECTRPCASVARLFDHSAEVARIYVEGVRYLALIKSR